MINISSLCHISVFFRTKPRGPDGEFVDIRLAEFPVDRLVEEDKEPELRERVGEEDLRRENEVCAGFVAYHGLQSCLINLIGAEI